MIISCSEKLVVAVVLVLVVAWAGSGNQLAAQSVSRVLVVVTEESDADWVKRIASEHVVVERLCAGSSGEAPSSYDVCNAWARGLLDFRLLIVRASSPCPIEAFWRDRLAVANPRGKVCRLAGLRCNGPTACEREIQIASQIHDALAVVLPKHRESLGENLQAELQRLRSLRPSSLQLSANH